MGGMTTFGNNDSVFSHGESSISMLNRLAEIAKEAYKYIPENDCTVACGTFVDVDTRVFLSAVQHFRESIEAYRDITEELDNDLREARKAYKDDKERLKLLRCVLDLTGRVHEQEAKSTQLEQRIKVLTTERDLAKKLAKQKSEELKRQLNEKHGIDIHSQELKAKLDEKCREVGRLTHEIWELQEIAEFWEDLAKKGYVDTDIAHMYPKTTLKPNNPANFCGNCRHYAQMGKDNGDIEGICTQYYIKRVDPDDASCEHFKPTYDKTDKPDHEVCDNCDGNCDTCGYYPF